MSILEKINFRQPKYMLPAILYLPLLGASYFIFDLFRTEKAEVQDTTLQTTEFLNPELPEATLKNGDGIGSKYENMTKSWGRIQDYTAVDNIERDNPMKTRKNMNRNTPMTTSPCSEKSNRKRVWRRKLPTPRNGKKKPSRNWRKPLPKPGCADSRK